MLDLLNLQNEVFSFANISISSIVFSHLFSLILSFLICFTYVKNFNGVLYQKSFLIVIILISLITTSLVIVISRNLALSLGMIGALSIIRFRTAVKDPIDVIYLFWGLSVGISCGVSFFKLGLISSLFISITMFLFTKFKNKATNYLMVVSGSGTSENTLTLISNITDIDPNIKLKSENYHNGVYEIVLESSASGNALPEIRETITKKYNADLRIVSVDVNA